MFDFVCLNILEYRHMKTQNHCHPRGKAAVIHYRMNQIVLFLFISWNWRAKLRTFCAPFPAMRFGKQVISWEASVMFVTLRTAQGVHSRDHIPSRWASSGPPPKKMTGCSTTEKKHGFVQCSFFWSINRVTNHLVWLVYEWHVSKKKLFGTYKVITHASVGGPIRMWSEDVTTYFEATGGSQSYPHGN